MGRIEGGPGSNDLRCGSEKAGVEGASELQVAVVTVSVKSRRVGATVGGRYGGTHIIPSQVRLVVKAAARPPHSTSELAAGR